jgi:RsiW-degrading membrane proteinase PrsW (M82 family)
MMLLAAFILGFGLICVFKPNDLRNWGDQFPWSSRNFWKQRRLPTPTWLAVTRTFGGAFVILGTVGFPIRVEPASCISRRLIA